MLRIICLHSSSDLASYRYRIEQFMPFWREYGIEMHLEQISGKNYLEKLKLAFNSREFDYVILQKKVLSPLFINIIASRSRLVFDYDDAIYSAGSHTSGYVKPSHAGSGQTIRRLQHVLKKSSLVFAGSTELAEYSRRFNPSGVHLIPTALGIPAWSPGPRDPAAPVTIGWIGITSNIPYLALVDEAARRIQERYPEVVFSLMSGAPAEGLTARWTFVPWSRETEQQWLQSIDIGIMPLTDDEWSRGKCAFKLLQYMSYAKPVIASPVGANLDAVIQGKGGYLASSAAEWFAAFESLIKDPGLRRTMGEESLKLFLGEYERKIVQGKIAGILNGRG